MKVSSDHFAVLKEAIGKVDLPEYREKYRKREIARAETVKDINVRYRWDLYWYASRREGPFDFTRQYNSNHLDTALRRIVPDVE